MPVIERDIPPLFDRQKLLIERLYDKIDYHKAARLRVPSYVVIANFGLLALSTHAKVDVYTTIFFACGFVSIGLVGLYALRVVKAAFSKNVEELDYLYGRIDVKTPDFQDNETKTLAEPASSLWNLLVVLIILATFFPVVMVFLFEFPPILPKH